MLNLPINTFYMIKVLKAKLIDYIYNGSNNNEVIRMNNESDNIFDQLMKLSQEADLIINNIYLGSSYNAANYNELNLKNIGLIINITKEIPNYYKDDFEYYNIIDIDDTNDNHISGHIDEIIRVINKYNNRSDSKNILIHCFMGSSRSASLLAGYVSYKTNMTK